MKIEIDLPFSWCEKCEALEIETQQFYFEKSVYSTHKCKNESFCICCENARKKEIDND